MGQERSRSPQQRVKLVEDGDTVLLDGGSTTYEVARLLVGRPLQIVTNSLPVANLFASNANHDLVLVGGYVYPRTGVALGPYANEMLERLNVRRTILSVSGINDRGFFNNNLLLVETERAMMRRRRRSDRRGRQHEVRPPEPGAFVPAWRRSTPGGRSRNHRRMARQGDGRRRPTARCRRDRREPSDAARNPDKKRNDR